MTDSSVILTGFMGSGKSSVGRILAESLGCPFIDLDTAIITEKGRSINEIFSSEGEYSFRSLERTMLERVLAADGAKVVATGGGAVINAHNRLLMRQHGLVVNLKAMPEQILQRLQGCDDRPILSGERSDERVLTLINDREQFYADADIRIDTDGKSVEDVAVEILCRFKGGYE